jgi:hypothetical protein
MNKRRYGCLFYGGVVAIVLMLLVLSGALVGAHYYRRLVSEYTDAQPAVLPIVQMPAPELQKLRQRVADFKEAVNERSTAAPLELSGEEINGLIASEPEYEAYRGKIYATIEGDRLTAKMSAPLDQFRLKALKGRYFNGQGTFRVSLQDGTLVVIPTALEAKGKPLPARFMSQLKNKNLASDVNQNPPASMALEKLKTIEIKNGKLVIVAREP